METSATRGRCRAPGTRTLVCLGLAVGLLSLFGCGGGGDGTPNRAPVAQADQVSTSAGAVVTIDVLQNDSDPDGDRLVVVRWSNPGTGTVDFLGAGVFRYSPAAGFTGKASFTYDIGDHRGGLATGLVEIQVGGAAIPTGLQLLPGSGVLSCDPLPVQFTAIGVLPDASLTDVTGQASWLSSDPTVATVDLAGRVAPVMRGTTTITAGAFSLSASSTMVVPGDVASQGISSFTIPGGGPRDGYLWDLNTDGRPDLVVPSRSATQLQVYLGQVGGAFSGPTTYNLFGNSVWDVVAEDFDGNSTLDLAVAWEGSGVGGIAILLGFGDGTFAAPVSRSAPGGIRALAVGRFDGDANLDLVSGSPFGFSLYFFSGNGDGTFDPGTTTATSIQIRKLVSGRFDGDLALDLAAIDTFDIRIFRGNGSGGFAALGGAIAVGSQPMDLVSGDFDGNGIPDLATANFGGNSVSVLVGDGIGGFSTTATIPTGLQTVSLRTAQVDGGAIDLIATSELSSSTTVLIGNGNGTFAADPERYFAGSIGVAAVAGDLDLDGTVDMVVLERGVGVAIVHRNVTPGRAAGSRVYHGPTGGSGSVRPQALAVADFDQDGFLDLAASRPSTAQVAVLRNRGDGSLREPAVVTGVAGVGSTVHTAAGRLNADGFPDLVVAGTTALAWLPGNGAGGFGAPVVLPLATSGGPVLITDLNGDGNGDIVHVRSGTGQVAVALGNGAGGFVVSNPATVGGSPRGILAGRIDSDLDMDVAIVSSDVRILLGDGAGGLGPPISLGLPFSPNNFAMEDFDGDGDLDVAALADFASSVTIQLGNGDGTFSAGTPVAMGAGTNITVQAGRMDCDALVDLVVARESPNQVLVFRGNGDGTFGSSGAAIPIGSSRGFDGGQQIVILGDLNDDGRMDVLAANMFNNNAVQVVSGP